LFSNKRWLKIFSQKFLVRKMSGGFIYLIHEREFMRLGEHVYKIGKTTQDINKRTVSYPKGSKLIFTMCVNDCHSLEKTLIANFTKKYKHRPDYGAEYFEGCNVSMMYDILNTNISLAKECFVVKPTFQLCIKTDQPNIQNTKNKKMSFDEAWELI